MKIWMRHIGKYGIMIIVILLVPAINLSGLTHTRMRRRLEELGIRKSFGATQGELVWQVLNENFCIDINRWDAGTWTFLSVSVADE